MNAKIIFGIIGIAVTGLIVWKISDNKSKAETEIVSEQNVGKIAIEIAKIKNHNFEKSFTSAASIDAVETIMVNSEATGAIKQFNYKLGDVVKKGQLIASIDNDLVKKQYQMNVINLERIKITYNKYKILNESNNIPKNEFQNIEFELKSAEKQVAIAEKTLSQSNIIAPISGTIVAKNYNTGDVIQAYSPVLTIATTNKLKSIVNLDYDNWSSVNLNDKVDLIVNDNKYSAVIVKKIAYPTQSKTYPIEINIESNKNLIPGLTVDVIFNASKNQSLIAIPRSALEISASGTFCYAIQKGKIEKVKIETGIFDTNFMEVKNGIDLNTEIISKGIQAITPKTKLQDLKKSN